MYSKYIINILNSSEPVHTLSDQGKAMCLVARRNRKTKNTITTELQNKKSPEECSPLNFQNLSESNIAQRMDIVKHCVKM
jgi:hypothetical protein